VGIIWLGGDDDTAIRRLGHLITQGLGDRIERQRPVDEALDKARPLISFCRSAATVP
jgi:hypothetical protein